MFREILKHHQCCNYLYCSYKRIGVKVPGMAKFFYFQLTLGANQSFIIVSRQSHEIRR